MAASEASLTWGGLPGDWRYDNEEEDFLEESLQALRARLRDMALAARAKDAALQDLQSRLHAALEEVKQGRAKEAAFRRRAEIAEAAEEALASQIAQLEAEAYASITHANNVQRDVMPGVEYGGWGFGEEAMRAKERIYELEKRLQAESEQASGWKRYSTELEAEAEQGRAREAALLERAEMAEAAEEALAAQMAELEAEAFLSIAPHHNRQLAPLVTPEWLPLHAHRAPADRHVPELQRCLVEAECAVVEAEEEKRGVEEADEDEVRTLKKVREAGPEGVVSLMMLHELAGMVKLRGWSRPSVYTLNL